MGKIIKQDMNINNININNVSIMLTLLTTICNGSVDLYNNNTPPSILQNTPPSILQDLNSIKNTNHEVITKRKKLLPVLNVEEINYYHKTNKLFEILPIKNSRKLEPIKPSPFAGYITSIGQKYKSKDDQYTNITES